MTSREKEPVIWDLPADEQERMRFAEVALDPQAWFAVAENLVASIDTLWPAARAYFDFWTTTAVGSLQESGQKSIELTISPPPDVRGAALMLAAYAAENLCKGVLVARLTPSEKTKISEKGRLPNRLLKPDLSDLLRHIGFELSRAETDLANRLARFSVWSGRYPIPTGPDKLVDRHSGKPLGA